MAAKKKSTKKVMPKGRRPPKQVFISFDPATGDPVEVRSSKKHVQDIKYSGDVVAGPYVLVERVRNK